MPAAIMDLGQSWDSAVVTLRDRVCESALTQRTYSQAGASLQRESAYLRRIALTGHRGCPGRGGPEALSSQLT
jgi:hypothetical protein